MPLGQILTDYLDKQILSEILELVLHSIATNGEQLTKNWQNGFCVLFAELIFMTFYVAQLENKIQLNLLNEFDVSWINPKMKETHLTDDFLKHLPRLSYFLL